MQIVAAVALGDLAVYWFHRACHTFEPLWRFLAQLVHPFARMRTRRDPA